MVSIPNRRRLRRKPFARWKETVYARSGSVRIYPEAKLCCDDDLLARDVAEKSTQKLLILVGAVDLRRVKKVTSHIEVALKNSQCLGLICRPVSV